MPESAERRVTVACACMYAREGGIRAKIYAAGVGIFAFVSGKIVPHSTKFQPSVEEHK